MHGDGFEQLTDPRAPLHSHSFRFYMVALMGIHESGEKNPGLLGLASRRRDILFHLRIFEPSGNIQLRAQETANVSTKQSILFTH